MRRRTWRARGTLVPVLSDRKSRSRRERVREGATESFRFATTFVCLECSSGLPGVRTVSRLGHDKKDEKDGDTVNRNIQS